MAKLSTDQATIFLSVVVSKMPLLSEKQIKDVYYKLESEDQKYMKIYLVGQEKSNEYQLV